MTSNPERRPIYEIIPIDQLYRACCDDLLAQVEKPAQSGNFVSRYWGDSHYSETTLEIGESSSIIAQMSDYYASSTVYWDLERAEGWGAHETLQRELLERQQSIIHIDCQGAEEGLSRTYFICRPADVAENGLLIDLFHGDSEFPPHIEPGTYDPNDIVAIVRLAGEDEYKLVDPASEPILAGFYKKLHS